MSFSPNSKVLASAHIGGTLMLWDVEKRISFPTVEPGTLPQKLQFSGDSTCLFTENGTLNVELPGGSGSTAPRGEFSRSIFVCDGWVLQRGNGILLLSTDYDRTHMAVTGAILAVPLMSGQIAFMDFSHAPTT
jgi:WD40 repeat protein